MPQIKNEVDVSNPLAEAIRAIRKGHGLDEDIARGIVDVITFCVDPHYLAIDVKLWIGQIIILKCYYMGSIGNESLKLTQEEWEWLYAKGEPEEIEGVVYENNIKDVIKKMLNREKNPDAKLFKDLQLVLGRRGGKTFLASVITVYEAYKLLMINNGDPHSYYNLPADDEIAIINVALSQQQAGRLFGQVQSRIRNSPFFKGRVSKETASEIRLYTDGDLAKKAQGANLTVPGSILLLCGHSNPDSLAGYSAILILFDEIAFYDETGKVTGKYFYARLKPSLSKFFHYDAGRIVQISSPNSKMGIFYETWEQAKSEESMLSFQLPTWSINPDVKFDEDALRKDRETNIELFNSEYGAQWASGGTYGNYFEPGLVDRCIRGDVGVHDRIMPGCNYYLHVDPASGGNNYAAVLVAKQRYTDHLGRKRNLIFLAGCWVWRPVKTMGLIFSEIDGDIIKICQKFRPQLVTYDDYHSKQSLEKLMSHGIRTRKMSYNRNVKNKIYQNLTDLMCHLPRPELVLYDDGGESSLLCGELRSLKKKQIQRGISIIPDKHGDIKTDDLADCLAGACNSANDGLRMGLPEPVTVRMNFA